LSVVVDSSVVVAALVDTGDDGGWAETVLQQVPLFAPELIRVEVTNVLRRLEHSKRITTSEANAAYQDFMNLDFELHAFEPFAERVWELRRNVTSYDAWYVALAEVMDLPLATLDARLAKVMGPNCRFLTPASSK
jgi:predicted nucleic acid-binding protein